MKFCYECWNGARDLFVDATRIVGKATPSLRIAELGCQKIKTSPESGMRRLQSAKSVFEWFGATHVSFDLNGKHRSLMLDLREPFTHPELVASFDIVTNFGTMEHVQDRQQQAFSNMHWLCRTGGLMIHLLPGRLPDKHGDWRYSRNWLRRLAGSQQYRIHQLYRYDVGRHCDHHEPKEAVYVASILERTTCMPFNCVQWEEPEYA